MFDVSIMPVWTSEQDLFDQRRSEQAVGHAFMLGTLNVDVFVQREPELLE